MNLIAVVDKNWAIGLNGRQVVSIPEDTKFFREETYGKVLVMGRKTLESLTGGRPLESRKNIILSRNPDFEVSDAVVCHSMDELKEELKKYASEDIYVIGGEKVYEEMLDLCDTAHITKVDYRYEADTYFPNLDKLDNWKATMCSDEKTYFDLCYEFVKYEKKK